MAGLRREMSRLTHVATSDHQRQRASDYHSLAETAVDLLIGLLSNLTQDQINHLNELDPAPKGQRIWTLANVNRWQQKLLSDEIPEGFESFDAFNQFVRDAIHTVSSMPAKKRNRPGRQ